MKTNLTKSISLLLVLCMLFSMAACGTKNNENVDQNLAPSQPVTNDSAVEEQHTVQLGSTNFAPVGEYNEGVVLVKSETGVDVGRLQELNCVSAEPLYAGSNWYQLTLKDGVDTVEAVNHIRQLGCFDAVDYDYVMKVEGATAEVVASGDCGENVHHFDSGSGFQLRILRRMHEPYRR